MLLPTLPRAAAALTSALASLQAFNPFVFMRSAKRESASPPSLSLSLFPLPTPLPRFQTSSFYDRRKPSPCLAKNTRCRRCHQLGAATGRSALKPNLKPGLGPDLTTNLAPKLAPELDVEQILDVEAASWSGHPIACHPGF